MVQQSRCSRQAGITIQTIGLPKPWSLERPRLGWAAGSPALGASSPAQARPALIEATLRTRVEVVEERRQALVEHLAPNPAQ